jgi:Fe2+ or Zn2+ uptake regulation protein
VRSAATPLDARSELKAPIARLIRDGVDSDQPDAVRIALASAVNGMVRCNWSASDCVDEFMASNGHLACQARQLWRPERLGARIERIHRNAVGRHEAWTEQCRASRLFIFERWQGNANSQLLVLLGLYSISEICGRLTFTLSARQLAESAGVGGVSDSGSSWQTAWRACRQLADLGLIAELDRAKRDHRGEIQATSQVRLLTLDELAQAPVFSQDHLSTALRECGRKAVERRNVEQERAHAISLDDAIRHVAWEQRQGLGLTAARCWYALMVQGEQTPKQLTERLRVGLSTVYKTLSLLAKHGLAHTASKGRWLPSVDHGTVIAHLDAAAEKLGISNRRVRRRTGFMVGRAQRTAAIRQREGADLGLVLALFGPFDDLGRALDLSTGEIIGNRDALLWALSNSEPIDMKGAAADPLTHSTDPAALTITNLATGEVEHLLMTTVEAAVRLVGGRSTDERSRVAATGCKPLLRPYTDTAVVGQTVASATPLQAVAA